MKILAIETSCDDTGIAILEANKDKKFEVLSNFVASQIEIHQQYGGVFPAMAKREHQKNIVPVFEKALKEADLLVNKDSAQIKEIDELKKILEREPELLSQLLEFFKKYEKPNIDIISVVNGPGLEPCLWVGVNFAKAISFVWGIPIVPVNHIESHILINLLENDIKFPAISLVASGGHTQIILIKKIGQYKILGETRDDAAGECFDKCAKILGLGYPGGPIISELAKDAKNGNIKLPRPMISTKDYDFSFSGLKTAVLYMDRKIENKTTDYKKEMAAEIQNSIVEVLTKKTIKAAKDFKAKTIILGGGVSANRELKNQFDQKIKKELPNTKFIFPKIHLSTDNALMSAITAYFYKTKKISWKKLQAQANLRIGER